MNINVTGMPTKTSELVSEGAESVYLWILLDIGNEM